VVAVILATALMLLVLGGVVSTALLLEGGFYDGVYDHWYEMPTVQELLQNRMEWAAIEYADARDLADFSIFSHSYSNILMTITAPDGTVLFTSCQGDQVVYETSVTYPAETIYDVDALHGTYPFEALTVTASIRWPLINAYGDELLSFYTTYCVLQPLRAVIPMVTVLAAVLLLACVIFLLRAAGHRAGVEGIVTGGFDRFPLEPLLLLWCALGAGTLLGLDALYQITQNTMVSTMVCRIICVGILAVIWFWLLLSFLMTVATRRKAGQFRDSWLVVRGFRKLRAHVTQQAVQAALDDGKKVGGAALRVTGRGLKGLWGLLSRLVSGIGDLLRALPGTWGLLIPAAALLVLNLAAGYQMRAYWDEKPAIVLLLDAAALLFLWRLGFSFNNLLAACQRLAAGDLTTKMDTAKLRWKFKTAAESLNTVGDGMAVAVEERMKSERMKTELITNVSHDIKTPLTSIVNYVDLLSKEPQPTEAAQEYVAVLERQSLRLKKLIEDLVEASKASTGSLAVTLEPVDLCEFLQQAAAEYAEPLEQAQLHPVVQTPEGRVYALADGKHLWRILDNLLGNACKYSQPGTRLYLSLVADGEQAHILVKNISREPLNISADELMERFVRGDSARSTEGSGLGLSIARSLADIQGAGFSISIDGDLFKAQITLKRLTVEQP
jgi:signal transduction histidine kinase